MSKTAQSFDFYHKWLGIPPAEQPPNHYRLLGIATFEEDADVIETAAEQRMALVRTRQTGKYAAASQKLLNEIAAARLELLQPERKKAYDESLGRATDQKAAGQLSPASALNAATTNAPPAVVVQPG